MTAPQDPDTEQLIEQAGQGDLAPGSNCWFGTESACSS
jgi:hypothetical protein